MSALCTSPTRDASPSAPRGWRASRLWEFMSVNSLSQRSFLCPRVLPDETNPGSLKSREPSPDVPRLLEAQVGPGGLRCSSESRPGAGSRQVGSGARCSCRGGGSWARRFCPVGESAGAAPGLGPEPPEGPLRQAPEAPNTGAGCGCTPVGAQSALLGSSVCHRVMRAGGVGKPQGQTRDSAGDAA